MIPLFERRDVIDFPFSAIAFAKHLSQLDTRVKDLMASRKEEKGAKSAFDMPNRSGLAFVSHKSKRDANAKRDRTEAALFLPKMGVWSRIYLRLEAAFLLLAANWKDDCERRNARFLWSATAMAFGAAFYYQLPDEPNFYILLAIAFLSIAWLWRRAHNGALDFWLLLAISGLSGLTIAVYHGQFSSTASLPYAFSSSVTGVIEHIDYRQTKAQQDERWTIRVQSIDGVAKEDLPNRLLLVRKSLGSRFEIGSKIRVRARLLPLSNPAYPGGFDYGRYLWARSIGGQGYMARSIALLAIPGEQTSLWDRFSFAIEQKRNAIATYISKNIEGEAHGLAIALAVGKRDYLDSSVENDLRHSGLAHILAISGLHMALVAMSIFWGSRALLACIPRLALAFPIKQWAAFTALVCAAGYLLLSGGSVATIRAFAMTAVFLMAILLGRSALTLHNLSLALILVVILQPYTMVEAGMQMSFAATTILIASYDRIRVWRLQRGLQDRFDVTTGHLNWQIWDIVGKIGGWVGGIAATSLLAGFAVLPFSLAHFQQMAPLGLLANVMAMPILMIIVMPFGLVSVFLVPMGLQSLTMPIAAWGLELVIASASWIADKSDERLLVVSGHGIQLSLFVLVFAIFAIHRKYLAWLAIMPLGIAVICWRVAVLPDLWIPEKGNKVAFRGDDNRWHMLGASRMTLDISGLLKFDGDPRVLLTESREERSMVKSSLFVSQNSEKSGCDKLACFAMHLKRTDGTETKLSVGLVRHPSAFQEACLNHDIVVSKVPIPADCKQPKLLFGPRVLNQGGARFLWFDPVKPPTIRTDQTSPKMGSNDVTSNSAAKLSGEWEIRERQSRSKGYRPWH